MLHLYNTLTHSFEIFTSIQPLRVGIYSCGPTVYDYQHIGHMRRYVGDDILMQVLRLNGYQVKHAMNITDVGHLVSDADEGEDKMEKGARKHGLSVWDIAKKFEQQFKDSCSALGISLPKDLMHATDYIPEQIALIKLLEEKGYTYRIEDGIYFDTAKFPDYFQLSRQNPDELKAGARVEFVQGKKNVADFALWKFSPSTSSGQKREMEWESPWGVGFPGWHIECSAMSMKALGATLDIHTGGIDHINIHHTNEIAQSEAATGQKFVNYWVHHNFLLVNGEKMSKSLENFYTVQDVIDKGFDPLALRYLYLQTHYRQEMNFTWESLKAAQRALQRLRGEISNEGKESSKAAKGQSGKEGSEFDQRFLDALNEDLNTPKALAVVWELVKAEIPAEKKIASLRKMDEVLGLELFKTQDIRRKTQEIPDEILKLVKEREDLRKKGEYEKADELRERITTMGFAVKDLKEGSEVEKINK